MKDFPRVKQINEHNDARKQRIYDAFVKSELDPKAPQLISKADFEAQFPLEEYELYTLSSMVKIREDMQKADDYSDEAFQNAVKGVQSFVVQHEGKSAVAFVRKKEAGE
jgi:hypothetical protein